MNRTIGALLFAIVAVIIAACDVVAQLPVIRTFPPTWSAETTPKILSAVITQNNGALDEALEVRCEFGFKVSPGQLMNVQAVEAEELAGNVYNCTLPDELAIRNNHVLVFEWLVDSPGDGGQLVPVARSGSREFHVGCDVGSATFLAQEQTAVLQQFGQLTTAADILAAGYLPTHFTQTVISVNVGGVPVPTAVTVNKVFSGMGVAFARAVDLPSATGFLPSGIPQPGSPNLLVFLPSATVAGQPDLADPSATYQLIGWAYAANLATFPEGQPPSIGCFPLHEWFFHEEGVHTLDGGFSPGQGSAIGAPHPRLWDIHVWADLNSGIPRLGIFNVTGAGGATTPNTGFVAPANSFFYPTFVQP